MQELNVQDLSHVLVHTAYQNSRASAFLRQSKVNTECVPSGVKFAEPVMHQFTIGSNVEPNGHGTIAVKWDKLTEALAGKEDQLAYKKLIGLLKISNVYVGDAIANMLMVESVLQDMNLST